MIPTKRCRTWLAGTLDSTFSVVNVHQRQDIVGTSGFHAGPIGTQSDATKRLTEDDGAGGPSKRGVGNLRSVLRNTWKDGRSGSKISLQEVQD